MIRASSPLMHRLWCSYEASLVMAGLGMGCPGARDWGVGAGPPECAGSEARCIDWLWSWRGWMIEVLRAGKLKFPF